MPLKPVLAGCAALLLGACAAQPNASDASGSGGTAADAMAGVAGAQPLDRFCADVQHYMAGTTLPVVNVVHTSYDAFVLSKAQVRPLQTEQYAWYEDDGGAHVQMISCKMKTSDHLRTEYGADQSTGEQTCSGYNALTLAKLIDSVPAAQRASLRFEGGRNVVFDDDEITPMGPVWLAPYAMARVDDAGALHVKAKAMRNDWLDPRLAKTPDRFKGTRYCHLIAPDYLARVLAGTTPVDAYAVPPEALRITEVPAAPAIPGVPDAPAPSR